MTSSNHLSQQSARENSGRQEVGFERLTLYVGKVKSASRYGRFARSLAFRELPRTLPRTSPRGNMSRREQVRGVAMPHEESQVLTQKPRGNMRPTDTALSFPTVKHQRATAPA